MGEGVVRHGKQWVPCLVGKTKGAKTEVVICGISWIVFNENVRRAA